MHSSGTIRRISPVGRLGGVLAALALFGGCATPGPLDPVFTGPFFAPVNHAGEASLGGLRRVVLLPLWAGGLASPETLASLEPVIVAALQRENRFEVVTFSRAESLRRFRTAGFSSTSALPHGLLDALQEAFAADGVLFVDVTVFSPYRPLALGLRARLATIDGSRIVWTFDAVFSAENPAVVNAARRHVLESDGAGMPTDLSRGVLQSPGRFTGYAAAAMFATLPPVLPPGAASVGGRR